MYDKDFNSYTEPGWYMNAGTNSGQLNVPHPGDNGWLLVLKCNTMSPGNVRQIWIGMYSFEFKTRTYHHNSSSWSEWVRIVNP